MCVLNKSGKLQALAALAAAVLWCTALFFASRTAALTEAVSVRWQTGGVSPAALARQEGFARSDGAENWPEITLWEQTDAVAVTDGRERSSTANAIWTFGNCSDIANGRLLSGSFPARSDTEGCTVSEALADRLWGSLDVLGMPISTPEGLFYVRGVVEGDEALFYAQRPDSSAEAMSNMQLRFPGGAGRDAAELFLNRTQLGGGEILDAPLIGWAVGTISLLPAIAVAVGTALRILRHCRTLRRFPLTLAGTLPLAVFAIISLPAALGAAAIPERLIPTRWSDFGFWSSLFKGFLERLRDWLSGAPTMRDMALWSGALCAILFSLLAAVSAVAAINSVRPGNLGGLAARCILAMSIMPVCALPFAALGGISLPRAVLVIPSLCLAYDFLIQAHGKFLHCDKLQKETANHDEATKTGALQ